MAENPDGTLEGVAAVIDKDHAAELLAEQMDADALMILTEVEKVAIHWGKPNQEDLSHLSLAEAARYAAQGHFAPGSMLPKIQACMAFVRSIPAGRPSSPSRQGHRRLKRQNRHRHHLCLSR